MYYLFLPDIQIIRSFSFSKNEKRNSSIKIVCNSIEYISDFSSQLSKMDRLTFDKHLVTFGDVLVFPQHKLCRCYLGLCLTRLDRELYVLVSLLAHYSLYPVFVLYRNPSLEESRLFRLNFRGRFPA